MDATGDFEKQDRLAAEHFAAARAPPASSALFISEDWARIMGLLRSNRSNDEHSN
jgi:hypothetical protein